MPRPLTSGFDKAFLTIIDTHITTLVSAAFLFLFGTGPVKGFAITLAIGLLANLFTSVYVSRVIFDWHLSRMDRKRSSAFELFVTGYDGPCGELKPAPRFGN